MSVEDHGGARFTTRATVGHIIGGTGVFTPDEIIPFHVWVVVGAFTVAVAIVCAGWWRWLQRRVSIASPAIGDREAAIRVAIP